MSNCFAISHFFRNVVSNMTWQVTKNKTMDRCNGDDYRLLRPAWQDYTTVKGYFWSLLSTIIQIAYNVKAIFILDFLSYNLGCFEKFCEKFHINSIYHYLFSVEKSILVVHLKNLWTPFTRRCEAILYTTHLTFIALHLSLCIDDVYLTRNFFCRWQNSFISPRVQTRSYYV